ncbi:hypothetical protein, partial [Micromonospora vulcania]
TLDPELALSDGLAMSRWPQLTLTDRGLAMNAHAATDDTAAINARLAALTSALQEIDEDVSDETHRLARRLLQKSLPHTDGPSD